MFARSPVRAAAGATGRAYALIIGSAFQNSIAVQRDPRFWLRQPRFEKKLHQTHDFGADEQELALSGLFAHGNSTRSRARNGLA